MTERTDLCPLVDIDRSVVSVDDYHRMHPHARSDIDVLAAAANGARLFHRPLDAVSPRCRKVSLYLLGIGQD